AAAVVAYANVRDVMNSEFRQKIRKILPDDETKGQEEFQRETGINIEQDIDYVLAWMTPAPANANAHDKTGRRAGPPPPAWGPWPPAMAASSRPSTGSASFARTRTRRPFRPRSRPSSP